MNTILLFDQKIKGGLSWDHWRILSGDTESFFVLVFRVINKDKYVSFAWELLWCESKSYAVRFPGGNLRIWKQWKKVHHISI